MQARIGDTIIAEANKDDLISIEGNWYFPPSSVVPGALSETETPYTCAWKGDAQYFAVTADGTDYPDRAWSYPTPYPTAIERVGKDFSGYVAFWKDVTVGD